MVKYFYVHAKLEYGDFIIEANDMDDAVDHVYEEMKDGLRDGSTDFNIMEVDKSEYDEQEAWRTTEKTQ